MYLRAAEAIGGAVVVAAAGVCVALQTLPTPDTFKEYGIPLAYLLLTIAVAGVIIRVLWASNQKKDEKAEQKDLRMEAMAKEFSATVKGIADQSSSAYRGLEAELREGRLQRRAGK